MADLVRSANEIQVVAAEELSNDVLAKRERNDLASRGWLIVHPNFPMGFRHFFDPHMKTERTIYLPVPPTNLPVPLTIFQRPVCHWGESSGN